MLPIPPTPPSGVSPARGLPSSLSVWFECKKELWLPPRRQSVQDLCPKNAALFLNLLQVFETGPHIPLCWLGFFPSLSLSV